MNLTMRATQDAFPGSANASLRRRIRAIVRDWDLGAYPGQSLHETVVGVSREVALTPSGVASLRSLADALDPPGRF